MPLQISSTKFLTANENFLVPARKIFFKSFSNILKLQRIVSLNFQRDRVMEVGRHEMLKNFHVERHIQRTSVLHLKLQKATKLRARHFLMAAANPISRGTRKLVVGTFN
jgi:hypothetical protein